MKRRRITLTVQNEKDLLALLNADISIPQGLLNDHCNPELEAFTRLFNSLRNKLALNVYDKRPMLGKPFNVGELVKRGYLREAKP